MKTYNQPTTHVVSIAFNQGICNVSGSKDVNITTPSDYGDGSKAQ